LPERHGDDFAKINEQIHALDYGISTCRTARTLL
jgi:hypothetical protein